MRPLRTASTLRRAALLAGALALAAGTSCVSQSKYDEQVRTAQYYQRSYQDLEQFQASLEAENERLGSQLGAVELRESGFTRDLDDRMAELRKYLQTVGASEDSVMRFEVEGGYGFSLKNSVLFESGSSEVSEEGREIVRRLAEEIASADYGRVWVRGHTDDVPIVKPETRERLPFGNLQLSCDRALQVAGILLLDGVVTEARLAVAGLGPNEPLVPNTDATTRRRNRRVEILVLDRGESAGE